MSGGRILLARHGETAAKRRRLFLGRSELQLNEAGRAQAERLADAVAGAGLVRLYASPSGRTMQTAAIVGSRVGLSTVADERLVETHKGRWERRPRDEVKARERHVYDALRRGPPPFPFPPGGGAPRDHDPRPPPPPELARRRR